jgi:hypothetical protein
LEQVGPFYWDDLGPGTGPTPALGTKVVGSDGHGYVLVEAAGELEADDGVTINETTWVATFTSSAADATVPSDVVATIGEGSIFYGRLPTL